MDGPPTRQAVELLQQWLQDGPHDTLLVMGETCATLLARVSGAASGTAASARTTTVVPAGRWLQSTPAGTRYDAALASDVVETLGETDATRVLAGLRDIHAGRLLLLTVESARSRPADLLALGLTGLGAVRADTTVLLAYEYDLRRYKRTPDWLNPRHWAHPERWGRERW